MPKCFEVDEPYNCIPIPNQDADMKSTVIFHDSIFWEFFVAILFQRPGLSAERVDILRCLPHDLRDVVCILFILLSVMFII